MPECEYARRRGQHHHRRGETGAAMIQHKGIDKIAFTGSTEVGRIIRKPPPARVKLSWSWAASRPSSSLRTPTSTAWWKGGRRHLVQPGAGLLCRLRLLVQESVAKKL